MSLFKTIYYPTMLYETLRNYFAINSEGKLSILYRYLLSILWPLQTAWNDFEVFRTKEKIIANCKWQRAQLLNVLNYLFDNELQRITITEAVSDTIYVPEITLDSTVFVYDISVDSTVFVPDIDSPTLLLSSVTFNLPTDLYNSPQEFMNVANQINIGLPYNIAEL